MIISPSGQYFGDFSSLLWYIGETFLSLRFGDLDKVQMVLDGHSGRSRGFAFVYYKKIEDAAEVGVNIIHCCY